MRERPNGYNVNLGVRLDVLEISSRMISSQTVQTRVVKASLDEFMLISQVLASCMYIDSIDGAVDFEATLRNRIVCIASFLCNE